MIELSHAITVVNCNNCKKPALVHYQPAGLCPFAIPSLQGCHIGYFEVKNQKFSFSEKHLAQKNFEWCTNKTETS